MRFVFLPGMDGTGILFKPILELWTEKTPPIVLSYPSDRVLGYEQIESYVSSQLPLTEPYILIAESYSGPIAVRIAADHLPMMRGLVLCSTFVRRPIGKFGNWCRFLIGPYLFRLTLTRNIFEMILKWQGLADDLIKLLAGTLGLVLPDVLAARLKEALVVEAFEDLKECGVPVLCLYAERDWLLWDRSHELIREANPRVKMVGLDTSHFLLQTKPAESIREILAFAQALKNPD